MLDQESIYNIIKPEYQPIVKQKHYTSKFSPQIPPTASTFGNFTTSRPNVSNVNGSVEPVSGPHNHRSQKATMGFLKEELKPKPQDFIKKGTRNLRSQTLGKQEFHYTDKIRPPVPRVYEKPLLGIQSNKNYIVLNAIDNILAVPKATKKETNYLQKSDYGQMPEYLKNIKQQIQQEYELIQQMDNQQLEEQERKRQLKYLRVLLSESEVNELREGLKKKWEDVSNEYQTLTHKVIDTIGLKRKKQSCEKELQQLEKDMEKLNKKYIFVDNS